MTPNLQDEDELISLIFDRPGESLITGRKGFQFNIPTNYLPADARETVEKNKEKLTSTVSGVSSGLLSTTISLTTAKKPLINVNDLKGELPDLSFVAKLPKDAMFCIFMPQHRYYSEALCKILQDTPKEKLLSTLIYIRENVNSQLFFYATSVVLPRRKDTQNVALPPHHHLFPNTFISSSFLTKAREQALYGTQDTRNIVKIPINFTATDLDPEHRVAYWREDIGVNQHHWHWHTVYPAWEDPNNLNRDRRGELFYYMHQQLLARYDFERLSSGLNRVKSFDSFRKPITEGYYPKLDSSVASKVYAARQPNSTPQDVKRDDFNFQLQDMERWRDNVINSIYKGVIRTDSTEHTPLKGIDEFGNLVEASYLSPNKEIYGDLHNMGHVVIAAIHDPDQRYKEGMGVMGDLSTAMRDPLFYVWHRFINDIFVKYKDTLDPYTAKELDFTGIEIKDVALVYADKTKKKDAFYTFWDAVEVDVQKGLNFQDANGAVYVLITHLNSFDFKYNITVNNTGEERTGTVRIFLAPTLDESVKKYAFNEQRQLMIELDKFTANIQKGTSTITRSSKDSSVTIPFDQVYNNPNSTSGVQPWCKCGWPDYLLIPMGTVSGFGAELFVMITDSKEDLVDVTCCGDKKDAVSYCGLQDKKYPDKKPMGFPFDRRPNMPPNTMPSQFFLKDFLVTKNMFVLHTTIYNDTTLPDETVIDNKNVF